MVWFCLYSTCVGSSRGHSNRIDAAGILYWHCRSVANARCGAWRGDRVCVPGPTYTACRPGQPRRWRQHRQQPHVHWYRHPGGWILQRRCCPCGTDWVTQSITRQDAPYQQRMRLSVRMAHVWVGPTDTDATFCVKSGGGVSGWAPQHVSALSALITQVWSPAHDSWLPPVRKTAASEHNQGCHGGSEACGTRAVGK